MRLLVTAFILSGAAGLVYESIWSRYLGLFVGHSAYAQIIVLVIFMGGMSLGAWLVGERTARIRHPLRAYALVELAAGLIGLAFHGIFLGTSWFAYDRLFPQLAGGPGLLVAKWTLAALLILPQSILLGTTFPLMSAGAMRVIRHQPGRTLSMMYFANSLGAAAGVLLAGFVLLEAGGLPGTLTTAGAINLLVALGVYVAAKRAGWDDAPAYVPEPEPAPANGGTAMASDAAPAPGGAPPKRERGTLERLLLVVAFGTAVASFVYEIAWIRMLSLVLGSATHSFELMLSAFILGLALGAFWVRRYADRFADPVRALGIVQWVMGALAICTLPVYLRSFEWMAWLSDAVNRTDGGYLIFSVARYVLCMLVMFPATICAGMTLPLITRILYTGGAGERAIGRVYSVNTLGSILGVVLAGLVLMPVIGLKWLLITGAVVDIALGIALLVWRYDRTEATPPEWMKPAAFATVAVVFTIIAFTSFDAEILSSGVFRRGVVPDRGTGVIHYHVDGRTATVTVKQASRGGVYSLLTNGKPDASISPRWMRPPEPGAQPIALDGDMSTQVLLALNTIAHVPNAKTGAVIGHGSGVSSHVLLTSPTLEHLATIEIEPEMIEASKLFRPFNRRVFDDPRSQFVIDDAKAYFAAGQRKYDLILSEPSNPWVSGVSGLFTDEFYRRIRTHLTEDGVFGQWLHLYEINDELVMSVLAAIDRNFADYAIYFTAGYDILVVAKPEGQLPAPDWNAVLAWPALGEDLGRAVPLTPEMLDRTRVAGRAVLHPFLLADAQPNSDFAPILDLGAERARFLRGQAEGLVSLSRGRFDLVSALTGRRVPFASTSVLPLIEVSWVRGLVNGAKLQGTSDVRAGAPADARHRIAMMSAMLQADRPPADWQRWVDLVAGAESDIHLGTAGVADESFWQPVLAHAERHGAPAEARAALDVLYGGAAWDWQRVADATRPLAEAQRAGRLWLEPVLLRDIAVAAQLRLGNAAEARRVLGALTDRDRNSDPAYQFRTRLLYWYIAEAMGELK